MARPCSSIIDARVSFVTCFVTGCPPSIKYFEARVELAKTLNIEHAGKEFEANTNVHNGVLRASPIFYTSYHFLGASYVMCIAIAIAITIAIAIMTGILGAFQWAEVASDGKDIEVSSCPFPSSGQLELTGKGFEGGREGAREEGENSNDRGEGPSGISYNHA